MFFFFFFQAEDGIRDKLVTGVQTCALPILTETTSLVSVNHPFRLGRGSIGKVLPGREIKLDANGEILGRGESITARYWRSQEVQPVQAAGPARAPASSPEEPGWLRTEGIGAVDAGGKLYI